MRSHAKNNAPDHYNVKESPTGRSKREHTSKIKSIDKSEAQSKSKSKTKVKNIVKAGKGSSSEKKAKDKPRKAADSDKDEASEGWEDVEDEVDLKAQAR